MHIARLAAVFSFVLHVVAFRGHAPRSRAAERLALRATTDEIVAEVDTSGSQGFEGAKIVLVGAGPGDPGLLTLRAAKYLEEEAALVIADRLVSPEVLEMVRGELRVAKKAPGCAETAQQQIYRYCELTHAKIGAKIERKPPQVDGGRRGGGPTRHKAEDRRPFRVRTRGRRGAGGLRSETSADFVVPREPGHHAGGGRRREFGVRRSHGRPDSRDAPRRGQFRGHVHWVWPEWLDRAAPALS
eukprot:scaffold3349_cov246-Pinguiococcus_pyrenoidosus.AAC.1